MQARPGTRRPDPVRARARLLYSDGAPPPPEQPVRGRWWRVLGGLSIALSALLVAGSLSAYAAWRRLDGQIAREDVRGRLGEHRPPKLNSAMNILVLGSDSRAGENARYGTEIGQRSDTTILLHLSPGGEKAVGISFPRDSIVRIPACKKRDGTTVPARTDMINSAFALAGPACTWQTVESLTGIRIDHYVMVDFAGFKRVVNALDGVEICVDKPIDDPKAELHLKAGRQVVRGDAALGYVRTRYVLGDGSDLGRIKRQQAFMGSVVKKATDRGMLTDPARTYAFLSAATRSLHTDDALTLSVMQKLASGLRGLSAGKVRFVTVPVRAYAPNPARVEFAPVLSRRLFTAVAHDNAVPENRPAVVPAQAVRPKDVHVAVYNATYTEGAGGEAGGRLEEDGFDVVKVGTKRPVAARTRLLFGPGARPQAAALAARLPGLAPAAYAGGRPGRVYLIIGRNGLPAAGRTAAVPKIAGEIRADRDVCAGA
ncbi:LCP family protein [Actinomadura parmotrematis]|uniref:LCP family protein n=1 Tax=Actinomadura parmotrematis TaxID=2864039 RepID=A0ABS7FXY9_9ACTN|nr:LCP family protein [Actinomadura parmotrematis]MBW8485298.1 LCP family protein [Actinomadura parmotrematis]